MKRYRFVIGVSLLVFVISATGCNKGSDSAVMARVNRGVITTADFKKQVEELAPQMQQAVVTDPKARKEFLDDLIGIELVIQEAKRQGLDKDSEFKKRQEMLKNELERRMQEDVKNELFNSVLKKEIGDKLSKIVPPTDQEVRDYYNANKDKIVKAVGKPVTLKEIEPQLKMRILQEKRRDLYLEYANGLREKAKITVDDKVLDAAVADIGRPKDVDLSNLKAQAVPKKEETKETK
ncbi:MAG TPA: SurA N-terminal domain-containing protein [Nitrospirota bacterium]|nr:SurA N-terminal domain-containing protein [Nitrospirota bacterium]